MAIAERTLRSSNGSNGTGRIHPSRLEWDEPKSLEECEVRMEQLYGDYMQIQVQLGNPNRTNGDGDRLTGQEYGEWRVKALAAWTAKVNEYRFLKRWKAKTLRGVRGQEFFQAARQAVIMDDDASFDNLRRVVFELDDEDIPASLSS